MIIFLSKFLPLFVYPIGLTCLLIISGLLFWKKTKFARALIVLAFLVLFVTGNRYVASAFAKTLEFKYSAPNPIPEVDAIVLLGGGTEPKLDPRPIIEVNSAGDRVLYAAELFKLQPNAKLILSGGDIEFLDQSTSTPASDMANLLESLGIPKETIILQDQSQNTYEDALYSCEIIKENGYDSVLLVTSAFHMPRSVALFEKQGCQVIPAPTDYTITTASWEKMMHPSVEIFILDMIPSYSNISAFTKTMKEYIGMFTYRLSGKL